MVTIGSAIQLTAQTHEESPVHGRHRQAKKHHTKDASGAATHRNDTRKEMLQRTLKEKNFHLPTPIKHN